VYACDKTASKTKTPQTEETTQTKEYGQYKPQAIIPTSTKFIHNHRTSICNPKAATERFNLLCMW
jgi:hypothetical protein